MIKKLLSLMFSRKPEKLERVVKRCTLTFDFEFENCIPESTAKAFILGIVNGLDSQCDMVKLVNESLKADPRVTTCSLTQRVNSTFYYYRITTCSLIQQVNSTYYYY